MYVRAYIHTHTHTHTHIHIHIHIHNSEVPDSQPVSIVGPPTPILVVVRRSAIFAAVRL